MNEEAIISREDENFSKINKQGGSNKRRIFQKISKQGGHYKFFWPPKLFPFKMNHTSNYVGDSFQQDFYQKRLFSK